jgi:hypothetical protein
MRSLALIVTWPLGLLSDECVQPIASWQLSASIVHLKQHTNTMQCQSYHFVVVEVWFLAKDDDGQSHVVLKQLRDKATTVHTRDSGSRKRLNS